MATINVPTGVTFEQGTSLDDTITLTDPLGAPANGGGGSDGLVLDNVADTLVALAGGLTYTDATATWSVGGQALTNGFNSVTLSDGPTLVANEANAGILNPGASTLNAGNLGSIPLANLFDFDWDGAAASTTAFTSASIVSVDGVDIATTGNSFLNAEGAFVVSGTTLQFTANTVDIASQGNVGDPASFSYEVVVADAGGEERTVTATYNATVPFTVADDIWNAGTGASASVDETTDFGAEDDGNDLFNGNDEMNTITAGDGNDSLFGGNNNDTLMGGGDDDFIRGGNGDDAISVASGNNNLGGGAGNDGITAGSGNDTVFGGGGNDSISGNAGNNALNGGAGDDNINGGSGNDTIKGGDGADIITGNAGTNELRGGAGADTVTGGSGDDVIYTSLDGDTLDGGTGDDSFVLKLGTGSTTINNFSGAVPNSEADQLDVSGLGIENMADVLEIAYETTAGVTLELDADTTVLLTNIDLADLSNADFDFA